MEGQTARAPMSAAYFWITYVLLSTAPFLVFAAPKTLTAVGLALLPGALVVVLTLPLYLFGPAGADRAARRRPVILVACGLASFAALANLVWQLQT